MGNIFTDLKRTFQQKGILSKLIYVNVGVFVFIRLAAVLCVLLSKDLTPFLQYLEVPSNVSLLLHRPWTVLTYMFTHFDVLHILFNMLWLYWFGKLFLSFFNERQLCGLYIEGGIAGAFLFVLAYNVFPYFEEEVYRSFMMGASASVMAIVFAISFYQKNYEVGLLFVGRIKLIYLALFTLIIDLMAVTSSNAGGHIAHIGGALLGILFAYGIRNGWDLTKPVNAVIDLFVNLGRQRPRMNVSYSKRPKRAETDYEYNARKSKDAAEIDTILEKLRRSGYDSLSAEEKRKLFDASKK